MKEVLPPSTYEIYMQSHQKRTWASTTKAAKPVPSATNTAASTASSFFSPQHAKNPLLDYSLKFALNSTAKPFRVTQRKVQSVKDI